MLKRIITALCAVAVLLPILYFSDTFIFTAAIAAATLLCLFEMFRCMGLHKKIALTLPVYVAASVFPILQRLAVEPMAVAMIAFMTAVLYGVYLFALVVWSHGTLSYQDACTSCLISLYILLAMNMIVFIRDFGENGGYIYFLIFIGAWITDIFAYFT